MKHSVLTIALVLVAGTAWAVTDYIIPHTWNYKITVEIETPEGVRTGSAVRQVSARLGIRLMPEVHPVHYDIKGEAVVVDLGERGVVLGLINSGSYDEVFAAFPTDIRDHAEKLNYYSSLPADKKADLPYNQPKLVTFEDMNDPKSVALVYHQKMGMTIGKVEGVEDNFKDFFGEGVQLKSIAIEITNAPVSWGMVDPYLPKTLDDLKQNWKNLPYSEKQRINKLISFKQGETK